MATIARMKRSAVRRRFKKTEFTNASGTRSWRVSGTTLAGARVRENFAAEGEAETRLQELLVQALNDEARHKAKLTRLSEQELRDAELALEILPEGRTLAQAVRFFVDRWVDPKTSCTLAHAQQEFLQAREASGCRPLTLQNLRVRTQHLVDRFKGRLVADITPEDITATVDTRGRSPRSRSNERRVLHAFLAWCTRKGYCMTNPVAKTDAPKIQQGTPQILSLDECRAMLSFAASFKDGKWLPHVAISLFAGLRPGELAQLTWQKIDLQERTITVDGATSKVRSRRVVEMPENLVAWLRPFALAKQPITPPNFLKDMREIRASAGYGTDAKPWIQDLPRHTALSMSLALTGDEARTASWGGTSAGMLHEHYKALVTAKTAQGFFSIRPDTQELVALPAVKAA